MNRIVVQDYVYEYNYQDPSTYYDDVGEGDGPGNVTTPGPVNKYVSVWRHDDASWIFSAVFMVGHPGAGSVSCDSTNTEHYLNFQNNYFYI